MQRSIAGNPPERRVARLREFWERVSSGNPFVRAGRARSVAPAFNLAERGVGRDIRRARFFVPRIPPPLFAPEGSNGGIEHL